jgi:hypothetical protein
MLLNTERIPKTLGKLRKSLLEQGFAEEQTYQIILDLIRRGDSPHTLVE